MSKLIVFLVMLFSVCAKAQTKIAPPVYILKLGDEIFIKKVSSAIWAEDPSIFKIEDRGNQLRILSLKSGSSEIRQLSQSATIHILRKPDYQFYKQLEGIIPSMIGLHLDIKKGKIIIHGNLYRLEDYKKIIELNSSLQAGFVLMTKIELRLHEAIQNFINQEIKKMGLLPQALKIHQGLQLYLNENDSEFDRFDKASSILGLQLSKIKKAVDMAPTVRVQITIAEVKKDKKIQWGIQWPTGYSAKIVNTDSVINDLVFDAKAFEAQGYGKILASPNLLCRSGNEAEFWAGGEFPIKIFNQKVQDVVWKKYGIILKVKPIADASGRMHIQIESEVSSIDQSQTVDGIPGMLTDKVSSYFDLNESKTIALSGLIKSTEGKSTEGLPSLARIPILGGLFGSQDYKENRTELVIFVRPSIFEENQNSLNPPSHLSDL